jgi:hypothetical protein
LISSLEHFVNFVCNIKRTSTSAVLTSATNCRTNLLHGVNIEVSVFSEIKYRLFCM